MRDLTFGQFFPTNSPIHKLDSRGKLLFTIAFIVFIFFIESYVSYLMAFLFVFCVITVAKVPLRMLLKSLKPILFLVVFTALLNIFLYKEGNVLVDWWIFRITDAGIHFTLKMAFRLVLLVIGAQVLTLTTSPIDLTDGIESLLKPLKYIKFPVHDVALIMSLALRFIPNLMDETDKIIMAQKARGSGFDTGGFKDKVKAMLPILIPLFVSAFRRADELADALDARCYNATPNRTKMKKLKFGYRDLVALLVFGLLVTFIMLDKFYFGGFDNLLLILF